MKRKIGMVGIGLMGHGIARNLLKHGHELVVLDHPGNQPLDELMRGGASAVGSAVELARLSEIVILCVTGSPEVEAVLLGGNGVLKGLQPGAVVIDCSTAIPSSTERMCAAVEAAGAQFVDAPMTRTVQHAHEGKLNLLVGGRRSVFDAVEPVLRCFAENITYAGATGSGHRLKLIHNFVSLGMIALLSEASACAVKSGIQPDVLVEVLAKGGGSGTALERLKPALLDPQGGAQMQFFMSNAQKDLRYYVTMAQEVPAAHAIADSIRETLDWAVGQSGNRSFITELAEQLTRQ